MSPFSVVTLLITVMRELATHEIPSPVIRVAELGPATFPNQCPKVLRYLRTHTFPNVRENPYHTLGGLF